MSDDFFHLETKKPSDFLDDASNMQVNENAFPSNRNALSAFSITVRDREAKGSSPFTPTTICPKTLVLQGFSMYSERVIISKNP